MARHRTECCIRISASVNPEEKLNQSQMSQNKQTKYKQKENLLGSPSSYSEEHGEEDQSHQDRAPSTLVKPYHSNIKIYSTVPPPGSYSTLCMQFPKDTLQKQLRRTQVNPINSIKSLQE